MGHFDFMRKFNAPTGVPVASIMRAKNEFVDKEFPLAVLAAGWTLLEDGMALPLQHKENLLAVGVSIWSHQDIQFLQRLEDLVQDRALDVCVFNIDLCATGTNLHTFLPNVPKVLQTPIVAYYSNGQLCWHKEGQAAEVAIENV